MCIFFAKEIAHSSSDEQGRNLKRTRGLIELFEEVSRGGGGEAILKESRIPVPPVATILSESKVLGEAARIFRTRAMGVVVGDGFGGFIEGGETIRVGLHEVHDALSAIDLHSRCDVDENERSSRDGLPLLGGFPQGKE